MLPGAAQLSRPVTNNRAIKPQVGVRRLLLQGFFTQKKWSVGTGARRKKHHTPQKLRCGNAQGCSAGIGAVTNGGRCPLRKHPAERQRRQAAITGRHGHCQGSCALHWRVGPRVRARLRGGRVRVCAGARTWEERRGESESIQCSVSQLRADLVKCEICFVAFVLIRFSRLHQHQHWQADAGAVSPFTMLASSVSPLCRCGGYAEGYMWSLWYHEWVAPDPTSCCIIIVMGKLNARVLLEQWWAYCWRCSPRHFFIYAVVKHFKLALIRERAIVKN